MRHLRQRWERILIAAALRRAIRHMRAPQPKKAVPLLRLLARAVPERPEPHLLLAASSLMMNDVDLAQSALRSVASAHPPRSPYVLVSLAHLQLALDQIDHAKATLMEAIDRFPQSWRLWSMVGLVNGRRGNQSEEIDCLTKAASLACSEHTHRRTLFQLAEAFENGSQQEKAVALYQKILEEDPHVTPAYYHLVDCQRSMNASDPLRTVIEDVLATKELPEHEAVHLHFALGHLYHRSGLYDQAFPHFAKGNEYRGRLVRMAEIDSLREEVNDRQVLFTRERISQLCSYGVRHRAPVFIVGMPRSGTTLVEQILSSHPHIRALGERIDVRMVADKLLSGVLQVKKPYPKCAESLTGDAVKRVSGAIDEELYKDLDEGVEITMKLPENFWDLGLITMLFPEVKVIHCRRDPIDTCLSCHMQNFAAIPFAVDLERLAQVYRLYVQIMTHWRSVLPASTMFELDYEDFVQRPDELIPQICEFCNLQVDDKCLRFYENKRKVDTVSRWQVRRPIYKTAVNRWQAYRKYIGPLLPLQELAWK
jgi:tetratricopeptide (TPR) repeat protein